MFLILLIIIQIQTFSLTHSQQFFFHILPNANLNNQTFRLPAINNETNFFTLQQQQFQQQQQQQNNFFVNSFLKQFTTQVPSSSTFRQPIEQQECGVARKSISLIIDGDSVVENEFPWIAALFTRINERHVYICTATLITNRHFLTAAHCLKNAVPSQLRLIYGQIDLDVIANYANINRFVIHPLYAPPKPSHDIGVLTSSDQIEYTNAVRPICLTKSMNFVENKGITAGWGTDSLIPRTQTNKLTKIQLAIETEVNCLRSNKAFVELLSNTTFCAGNERNRDGRGPCVGDSGAPLFNQINDRFYLRGLVSTSLSKQNTCDLENYVIFVDVHKEIDWILSVIL